MSKNIKLSGTSSREQEFEETDSRKRTIDSRKTLDEIERDKILLKSVGFLFDKIDDIDGKVKELNNKNIEITQNNKKLEEEARTMKIDFIAIAGIFVTIFTFISIEIQILKEVDDFFRIAGFSLIIFGSLSGFIILLHSIFSEKEIKWRIWFLCVATFLSGILLGSIPYFINIQYSHCFLIN